MPNKNQQMKKKDKQKFNNELNCRVNIPNEQIQKINNTFGYSR